MTSRHEVRLDVRGPWSLDTSRRFWEGFAPAALAGQEPDGRLRTVFRVEVDWSYEAAAWAVLSQRVAVPQAARLRDVASSGELELPGRKAEYLGAVAEAWRPWRTWASFHLRAAFTASLGARTA